MKTCHQSEVADINFKSRAILSQDAAVWKRYKDSRVCACVCVCVLDVFTHIKDTVNNQIYLR